MSRQVHESAKKAGRIRSVKYAVVEDEGEGKDGCRDHQTFPDDRALLDPSDAQYRHLWRENQGSGAGPPEGSVVSYGECSALQVL